MRFFTLPAVMLLLLSSACGQPVQENLGAPEQQRGGQAARTITFAAGERDRLCLQNDGGRMAFITYASTDDTNCTVRGQMQAEQGSARSYLVPDGDQSCRIPVILRDQGQAIELGAISSACAYYCGPSASFAGKSFRATPAPVEVSDLAGQPLC